MAFPSDTDRTRPRHPFVGLAIFACAGIVTAEFFPSTAWPLFIVLAVLILSILARPTTAVTYAAVALGFILLHGFSLTNTSGRRLAQKWGEQAQSITVRGIVDTEPKISATGFASFLFQLRQWDSGTNHEISHAKIYVRWKGTPQFGDELQLFGMVSPVSPPRNPGEFDMRAYLARQDVFDQLFVGYEGDGLIVRRNCGNIILQAAHKARDWMQKTLTRGLDGAPDVQGLVSGMVLGLRHQTPDDIEAPFQETGTLHLFAVAGLHVGIVAQLLWIAATLLRLRRKLAITLIIPALFFYATITGLHPSSVRAALMSAVLLGAFLVERKAFALNGLAAAAVLLLCWNTNELFAVGFQLSFFVVTAIVLWADPIFSQLQRLAQPDPFLPRSLMSKTRKATDRFFWWLTRGLSVSLAAWIGALPLMLWYYNLVTPISLFANLAVVPIAFFILATGFLSLLAAPVSQSLSVIFNNGNWALAKVVLGLVQFFAACPGGHFYVERPHWPRHALAEITVLDVGAGGAVHIRSLDHDWLFDSGSQRDLEQTVRNYLHTRGVNRLDGLLLSHGDAAHIGGAGELIQEFRPREVIDSGARDRSRIHHDLIAQLNQEHLSREILAAGNELKLSPELRARILFPPNAFEAKTADDQSFVVQLLPTSGPRLLFTFDSGTQTEHALTSARADLRSELLIKGQHRSGISGTPEFLNAVQPQVIIATSRDFPNSERIADEWAEDLRARNISLFRQDESGAVTVRIYRDHWDAEAFLGTQRFPAKPTR